MVAAIPARAAYAETLAPMFPVLAHTTFLKPFAFACEISTVLPLSLNEPVGFSYSSLKKTWEIASKQKGYMLTGDYPLRMEGQKTIAFEIVEQLNGKVPDQILIPVGNGTLLTALHAAFVQMKQKKMVKKIPMLIGVQAEKCSPLVDAFEKKTIHFTVKKNPHTIAGAIECGNPIYGQETLGCVHETKGKMLAVSEKRMKEAKLELARTEGLYTEYSGAAAYAALCDHAWKGITVVLLCGHGLKE